MFKLYSIVVKKTLWTATEHLNPSLKWRHLAEYDTNIIGRLYQTIEKKGPVFAECLSTQKYHIIVTVKTMGFMQASMTTVVNIVVSITTNWLAKCSSNINYQKRVRGFEGFQTPKNRSLKARSHRPSAFEFIVSRCLEPLMKPKAWVFEMTSQSKQ